jgi:hypothetical protein
LRSILLASILVFPSLYFHIVSEGSSPASFTHVDEFYYLKLPSASFEGRVPFSDYSETPLLSFWETLGASPNMFINMSLGKISKELMLSPALLGILLDFFFIILAYQCFSWMFACLTVEDWHAELASLCCLCLPWIFIPGRYLESQVIFSQYLVFPPVSLNRFLPVMRGIYTQVSYPVIGICLGLFLRGLRPNSIDSRRVFIAAVLGGMSLFIYFFAWVALGAVMGIGLFTYLLSGFIQKNITTSKFVLTLFQFIVFFILGSAAPIYIIANSDLGGLARNEVVGQYWVVLPVTLLLVIAIGISYYKRRESRVLLLLFSLLLSECVLYNLQPLLKTILGVFHFPSLFIYPFVTACLLIIWMQYFSAEGRSRLLYRSSIVIVLFLVGIRVYGTLISQYRSHSSSYELQEVVQYMRSNMKKDDVISVLAFNEAFSESTPTYFSHSLLPSMVTALSERFVLHQAWAMSNDKEYRVSDYERELLTAFLFSGRVETVWPCVYGTPPMPGDSFSLTRTAYLFYRASMCAENSGHEISICQLLGKYRVDYLLWEKNRGFLRPEVLNENSITVFENKEFAVLQLQPEELRSTLCQDTR